MSIDATVLAGVIVGVLWCVLMSLWALRLSFVHQTDVDSVGDGVGGIFHSCAVGNVFSVIVRLVVIKVSHFSPRRSRADESQSHEVMDLPFLFADLNTQVSLSPVANRKIMRVPSARADESSSLPIGEISFMTRDGEQFFAHTPMLLQEI